MQNNVIEKFQSGEVKIIYKVMNIPKSTVRPIISKRKIYDTALNQQKADQLQW